MTIFGWFLINIWVILGVFSGFIQYIGWFIGISAYILIRSWYQIWPILGGFWSLLGGLVVSHPKHVVWWYMGGWVYGLPALNTYKTPLGPNTTRGGSQWSTPGVKYHPPPGWVTMVNPGGWYLGPGVFTGHLGLGAHNHPLYPSRTVITMPLGVHSAF